MADYRPISDTEVDPDAPVTSELAYAFRDNPIAIAEGAAGAPKVNGKALDIYLGSSTFTNSPSGLIGLDRVGLVEGHIGIQPGSSGGSPFIQVSFSADGLNWGGWQDVIGTGANTSLFRYARINLVTGQYTLAGPNMVTGTFDVPPLCNAVRFRVGVGSGYFDLSCTGGRP